MLACTQGWQRCKDSFEKCSLGRASPRCILATLMRASIAIAAHNEGPRLWKTVRSCLETLEDLDAEVVVVDDASVDDSVVQLARTCPTARIVRHDRRWGISASKDHAARSSLGRTIIFLDGHCKPEPGALCRLIESVEAHEGQAVVTPCVPRLDCEAWKPSFSELGFGFRFELERFDCEWVGLQALKPRGGLFETPAFVGCCVAMSRALYDDVLGFDRYMVQWGQEDLDFSLKTWLMGYSILNDPRSIISHRFRDDFDNYSVAEESTVVNTLRAARKNFTDAVWEEWLPKYRGRRFSRSAAEWEAGWRIFEELRPSLEEERSQLLERRKHDEHWYAEKFGLPWPVREASAGSRR